MTSIALALGVVLSRTTLVETVCRLSDPAEELAVLRGTDCDADLIDASRSGASQAVARLEVWLRPLQTQVFDERFKVTVAKQQLVGVLKAEGSDEDVNRLANRDPA